MKSDLFSLYKIAESNIFDTESEIKVPNIQRGLVWKAQQMELLWDSILREFPIGSMLVLKDENNKYDILDGQQRSNAIITGFNTKEILNPSPEARPNSILWLDLGFSAGDNEVESRKYGIRLTNTSHPWGFNNDGGKLDANTRRTSLKRAYGDKYPKDKKQWDIRQFVPEFFTDDPNYLPIPLAFLVKAAKCKDSDNIDAFFSEIHDSLCAFGEIAHAWKNSFLEKALNHITNISSSADATKFAEPFFRLNDYKVVFNCVDNKEDVEVLFNRVNKLGTRMNDDELAYAAIKHYGASLCHCPDISNVIKTKSKGLMLEQNLAQILFRYCFSDNKIHGSSIDAKTIRKYLDKPDDNPVIIKLRYYFANDEHLDALLSKAKTILLKSPDDDCQLPNFLFAEIAEKNPNLILLLLKLVESHYDIIEKEEPGFIQALIFYLYCFSSDWRPTDYIFQHAADKNQAFSIETVRNILRDSISREWCLPIVESFSNFKALQKSEFTNHWEISNYSEEKGYNIFKLLFPYETYQGCFMLKYAQRRYYDKVFGDFDPSSKEYWDEINRPWDHDHIIPKNWICSGDWQNVQQVWINSMGNIADIPFEQNRGKSDEPDWSYYEEVTGGVENDTLLYYDPHTKNVNFDEFKNGLEGISVFFMEQAAKRFIKISSEFLSLFKVLKLEDSLSPMQIERKNFLMLLQNKYYPNSSIYFKGSSAIEHPISDYEDIYVWQRPWLSIISSNDGIWHKAVSSYLIRENNNYRVERGNRKSPELELSATKNDWWERGSWSCRDINNLLNSGELDTYVNLFLRGDVIYNEINETTGFILDSSSFISYKGQCGQINIYANIYDYYGYTYAIIKNIDENDVLPDEIISALKSISHVHKGNQPCYVTVDLYKNTRHKDNCDLFAKLIKAICN